MNGRGAVSGAGTYPDEVANPLTTETVVAAGGSSRKLQDPVGDALKPQCPAYSVVGDCDTETCMQYLKTVYCGREWCDSCGLTGSDAHMRRVARWLAKGQQMCSMGEIVVTWPPGDRLRDKEALRRMGKALAALLKRCGYRRGLRRWHWFGDCPGACSDAQRCSRCLVRGGHRRCGCEHCLNQCGCQRAYHPHLNILVDGGFLAPEELEALKRRIRGVAGVGANVHYGYVDTAPAMYSKLKYHLRPTFRRVEWDQEMALRLAGFRNTCWWGDAREGGDWSDPPVWEVQTEGEDGEMSQKDKRPLTVAVVSLVQGLCPGCGKPLKWHGVVPDKVLKQSPGIEDLGAGYWALPRGPARKIDPETGENQ
jgi:hypothetical protein